MEIKLMNETLPNPSGKKDSIDTPECFGDYDKQSKLCSTYCAISIKCCILHARNPKIDILEKLLIHNQYAIKLH
ncbi:hypothetical protein [Desulfospira joergensenii]|uniref:hypothetical protein n=1 Tax=Desulfospira joergensenii TaxID=53329 RepID=UPI0003B452B2|nr:hypothetical protein [Desulfospira joergensenii]